MTTMVANNNDGDNDYYNDDNPQVGVRHILDVEEQDWLLREDVAKGFVFITIPNSLSSTQNTKLFVSDQIRHSFLV